MAFLTLRSLAVFLDQMRSVESRNSYSANVRSDASVSRKMYSMFTGTNSESSEVTSIETVFSAIRENLKV